MPTPADLLADALRRDGARPFLTAYDDASGERVELSVATTANWVAKTANFLVDEIGVEPGETVGVMLPLHWQTAIVLLATWSAGAVVAWDADPAHAVMFTDTDRQDAALERLPADRVVTLSLAPMGVDFSRLVAAQPDAFAAPEASGEDVVDAFALPGLSSGARVLTVMSLETSAGLAGGLIGPLSVEGSVVQVRHPDPSLVGARCVTEHVTHTVGISAPDLPRLD
jgi:uncharacterized protein (TIGR03089 family)